MLTIARLSLSLLGRRVGSLIGSITATGGTEEFTLNEMPKISEPDATGGAEKFTINSMPTISDVRTN